ncbi:MAG: AAA family ATPase [Dysgonamonadaceae bacterium]|jgi:hypothetical protein|nr:AAA family ATPase [Dysgonamonadaceae bacterium]
METKIYKRLPYGISDFKKIITENYAYVDKTRYIEMLENESNPNQFFIRPRKFGKSLFFTTLMYYYDLNEAENFEQLFGKLYIGKHPTPERNSYAILKLDFSGMDTSGEEGFKKSFSSNVQDAVRNFFRIYSHIFPKADKYVDQIEQEKPGIWAIEKVFSAAELNKIKLFIIIDEYDCFANDLIAMGNYLDNDFNKTMVAAKGLMRNFYARIKVATKSSIAKRTFITGASPVMLDDITSGYNIGTIFSLYPQYNEMMGFSQEEVEWLMRETGVDESYINIDIETYYGGYLFHKDGKCRVYNPAMMLYFFSQIIEFGKPPENIVDMHLKTDYERLRHLVQNDKNRETLVQIMKESDVIEDIQKTFPIDSLNDEQYFISLLFYIGLLTIKEPYWFQLKLTIPNYSIKTLYREYITKIIQETSPDLHIKH